MLSELTIDNPWMKSNPFLWKLNSNWKIVKWAFRNPKAPLHGPRSKKLPAGQYEKEALTCMGNLWGTFYVTRQNYEKINVKGLPFHNWRKITESTNFVRILHYFFSHLLFLSKTYISALNWEGKLRCLKNVLKVWLYVSQ